MPMKNEVPPDSWRCFFTTMMTIFLDRKKSYLEISWSLQFPRCLKTLYARSKTWEECDPVNALKELPKCCSYWCRSERLIPGGQVQSILCSLSANIYLALAPGGASWEELHLVYTHKTLLHAPMPRSPQEQTRLQIITQSCKACCAEGQEEQLFSRM